MTDLNNIKLTPKQNFIAVGFIILIVLTLALRLYFSGKAVELSGPSFVVANDAIAVMTYNNTIYKLDANGNILQQFAFRDIGLKSKVADLQLLDNERFVIGDWDNQVILLCEFTGPVCSPLTQSLDKHIRNFFKFHYHEASNILFIADTDRHRILHYALDTHEVKIISSRKQLLYPNDLRVEQDGFLYITDTNHHRIAAFEYKQDQLEAIEPEHRVPKAISRKKWPIAYFRLDNGNIYILQANGQLSHADLILLQTDATASKLSVQDGADITDITRMQNKLLLSDRELFAIYAIDIASHEFSHFGSEELLKLFAQHRAASNTWDGLSTIMLGLMVLSIVAMVGFIIFLAFKGQRTTPATEPVTADNLPPIVPGKLTWVDANPKFRLLLPALVILMIILVITQFALFNLLNINLFETQTGTPEQGILYAMAGMGLIFVFAIVNAAFNLYTKIGTDGIYIYIERFGRQHKLEPQKILYSNHYLLYANLAVVYRNVMKHYFQQQQQFEAYITPLLHTHGKAIKTFPDVLIHMIRHPNMIGIFNTVTIIVAGILLIYLYQLDLLQNS